MEAIPGSTEDESSLSAELAALRERVLRIKHEVGKAVVGQETTIELMLAAVFTGGHILLEGVPGIAKTLTAKMVARSLSIGFSRIQFTPDLMPTDVTGTSVFNLKTSEFTYVRGPIFANLVLIDEINRAPAKTQSSLFEVMEEKQITVDGTTYAMEYPFLVIATQNPIEQEGTYRLPEAQLDRFLFRIRLRYPTYEEETDILRKYQGDFALRILQEVKPVVSAEEIRQTQDLIEKIHIKDDIIRYIAKLVDNTRNNGDIALGASPRASLSLLRSSKAIAAMNGRDFVTPDDIKFVACPVLNHRIILTAEREMEGAEPEDVIREIAEGVEIPR